MADWGYLTEGAGSAALAGNIHLVGGTSPDVDGMMLDSISVWLNTAGENNTPARLALYAGGSESDVTGAELLADLGPVEYAGTPGWVTATATSSVSIPRSSMIWIGVKRGSDGSVGRLNNSPPQGDISVIRAHFNEEESDPDIAWPDEIMYSGVAYSTGTWRIYLTYSSGTQGGITSIGDDDSVAEADSGVPVVGYNLPTSGDVALRSGAIESAQSVSERTDEGFTWDSVSRGNLPFSDAAHTHQLVVDTDDGEITGSVQFNPADGFAAYPLSPGYASQVSGESVLAFVGDIEAGMQIKVPLFVDINGPVSIQWETVGGYATGRIASLGAVIDDSVDLPGVELFDGSGWDDIPVTMQPDGSVGPVPDPFAFAPVTGADPSTQYESNAITIAGIPADTDIPVSVTGGQYSVSTDGGATWGAWTSTPATVQLGYQVRVRGTSSATSSATVSVSLNAGGRIGTFSITTKAASTDTAIRVPVVDRNGVPVAPQGNLTAVVRANMTSAEIRYQTSSASIDADGMLSLEGPLGTAGSTVSLTLASADRQTVAFWPDCPVVEL